MTQGTAKHLSHSLLFEHTKSLYLSQSCDVELRHKSKADVMNTDIIVCCDVNKYFNMK